MGMEPTIKGVYDHGTVTTAAVVDFTRGNVQRMVLGGNVTLSVKNCKNGHPNVLFVTQDGTGSRTITWASADPATGVQAVVAQAAGNLAPASAASTKTAFGFIGSQADNGTAEIWSRLV